MNQALRLSIAENDDIVFPGSTLETRGADLKEWFDEYLLKYLKTDYDGELINDRYYKVRLLDGTGFVAYISSALCGIYFFLLS